MIFYDQFLELLQQHILSHKAYLSPGIEGICLIWESTIFKNAFFDLFVTIKMIKNGLIIVANSIDYTTNIYN